MPQPSNSRSQAGLIGLGLMGTAITQRLLASGFTVIGHDISTVQQDIFSKLGGTLARDATQVFEQCDRVLLSLPDDEICARVLLQADESLTSNHIVIDSSTGAPEPAIAMGQALASRGISYLDATISGSSAQVRSGEVLAMVGGSIEAFGQCGDLFATFAKQAIHTGPCGSGAKMKLVTNLVLGLNRAALAEGLVFAQALGVDGEKALHVLLESMAYSRIMDTKGEKMLREDFEPQARLSQHLKDVRLMLDAAQTANRRLPLTETHRDLLELAESSGLGKLDNSAVIRAIEQSGEPISKNDN